MAQWAAEQRLSLDPLREDRLTIGLTQTEVAAMLRRPQSFASKRESGERHTDVVELAGDATLSRSRKRSSIFTA